MASLIYLQQKAREIINSVADEPQARYQLRYDFYKRYGHPHITGSEGLGNSELAFLQWEINRGVLNPLATLKPGSPWWRAVNSHFLYVSTLADLIFQSGQKFQSLPPPVTFWLDYIYTSDEVSWYRAHNTSIIEGYQKADALAFHEDKYEQAFMNIVLYRLLYAQSMVEGACFGLLGKLFADPRGCAVALITDINAFYPSQYPMTKEEMKCVMHKAHNFTGILEDVFDELLIIPELDKLYEEAAQWNKMADLKKYVQNDKPLYPLNAVVPQPPVAIKR